MTTSNVFCPTNSPKKTKISSFTVRRDEEKQQIITFQKLNQTMNDSVLLKLSTDLRHVKSIRRKRESETSQPIRTTCAAVFKIEMWPGERAWPEETPVRYEIHLTEFAVRTEPSSSTVISTPFLHRRVFPADVIRFLVSFSLFICFRLTEWLTAVLISKLKSLSASTNRTRTTVPPERPDLCGSERCHGPQDH